MMDTHADIQPAGSGSDFYFEKALWYPKHRSPCFARKRYLPSSSPMHVNETCYSYWQGDIGGSPANSPGSYGTRDTSQCTDDESLCYSVESWDPGILPSRAGKGDYHYRDGDLGHSSSTLNCDHHDCFVDDSCFRPFAWVQDWFREAFQKLGSLPDDIQRICDYENSQVWIQKALSQQDFLASLRDDGMSTRQGWSSGIQ